MVCDALADVIPDAQLRADDRRRRAQRVREVNDHLVRAATRPSDTPSSSGSTVVALLARGTTLRGALGRRQPGLSLAGRRGWSS